MMTQYRSSSALLLVAAVLSGCSGLHQLAECDLDDIEEVADDEELDGTDMTAADARELVADYSGTITWVGDAEEPITVALSKAGKTSAVIFEDPDRCPPSFQYDVLADVSISEDGRYGEQGAAGTVLLADEETGTLTLEVDLSDVTGIRLPEDFDPAQYDQAWVEFKLSWDGDELEGGGVWKGAGGGETERSSVGCCTVELSPS